MERNAVHANPLPFMPHYRLQRRDVLVALLLLSTAFALSRWEYFYRLGEGRVLGGVDRDAGIYFWISQVFAHALSPSTWFNTPAFFPYSRSLAYSDSFLAPSVFISALSHLGLEHYQAYNLCILLAHFLFGTLTALLAFGISGQRLPSLLSGIAAITCAPLLARLGHPQLQFLFFLPAALLLYLSAFRSSPFIKGLCAGLLFTTAFLSSVYISLYVVLLLSIFSCGLILLRPISTVLRTLSFFALGFVLSLPLLYPFLLPYFEISRVFGSRHLYELYFLSATPAAFVSASPQSLLYSMTSEFSRSEFQFFPGFVVFFGAAIGAAQAFRHRRLLSLSSVLLVTLITTICLSFFLDVILVRVTMSATLWLSIITTALLCYRIGKLERARQHIHLSPRSLQAILAFGLLTTFSLALGPLLLHEDFPLPYAPAALFYSLFPGFSSARAVGRVGLLFLFLLYLLLPFALGRLRRSRSTAALTTLLALAVVIENLQVRMSFEPQPSIPSVRAPLAHMVETNDVALMLPLATSLRPSGEVASWSNYALHNVRAMNYFAPLGIPIINGYSGLRNKFMREFPGDLRNFPDSRSVQALEQIPSLRWIVYETSDLDADERSSLLNRLAVYDRVITVHNLSPHSVSSHSLSANGVDTQNVVPLDDDSHIGDSDGVIVLEFSPITALTKEFTLRVPSYPQQFLEIELQAHGEGNGETSDETYALTIYELDHPEGGAVGTFEIPADKKWRNFAIPLPRVRETARPLRLEFRSENLEQFTLRARRSQPLR